MTLGGGDRVKKGTYEMSKRLELEADNRYAFEVLLAR